MKLIVNPHKIEIEKTPVNEKEIDITKVQFEFNEIPDNYVKDAYFTYNGTSYKVLINNNECFIPYEVLNKQGMVEIGVVAYLVEDETEIKRYNPSPVYISTLVGSLKEQYENTKPITPTDKEQIEQLLQDGLNDIQIAITNASRLDVDAEKVDKTTTITITKQDGTQEQTEINDGIDGVSLENIEIDNRDLKVTYGGETDNLGQVVPNVQVGTTTTLAPGTNASVINVGTDLNPILNFSIPKGEAGAIKIEIVNELPIIGQDDTIYLVPYEEAETGNIYKEYVYINETWEELGSIPIEVDLSDYYTKSEVNNLLPTKLSDLSDDTTHRVVTDTQITNWNNKVGTTDYATGNVAGVIRTYSVYGTAMSSQNVGGLYPVVKTNTEYTSAGNNLFISKGTLENVLDARIGDINSALDTINGESV